jgi:hypothetical protein
MLHLRRKSKMKRRRHRTNAMHPKLAPLMDNQVPEECVAGGTRVAVGSWQKGTCVAIRPSSETWVVISFPEGFSYSPPKQRGVRDQWEYLA